MISKEYIIKSLNLTYTRPDGVKVPLLVNTTIEYNPQYCYADKDDNLIKLNYPFKVNINDNGCEYEHEIVAFREFAPLILNDNWVNIPKDYKIPPCPKVNDEEIKTEKYINMLHEGYGSWCQTCTKEMTPDHYLYGARRIACEYCCPVTENGIQIHDDHCAESSLIDPNYKVEYCRKNDEKKE